MRIHEVIYFTHELDILEAHLEEHQHFVEKFFIKESPFLWTGVEKPLLFTENLNRFSRFNVEVMVIPQEEFDLAIPRSFSKEEYKKWYDIRRDNRVKSRTYKWDEIREGADYVLSSDADEIIDSRKAHVLLDIMEPKKFEHIAIRYRQHQFWVNVPGKTRDLYRAFRGDIPHRSYPKGHPRTVTPTIGWHFCNCFLSGEDLRTKALGITTHYGFSGVDHVYSAEYIQRCLDLQINPFRFKGDIEKQEKRTIKGAKSRTDLSWAPKYIREHPEKFLWAEENG